MNTTNFTTAIIKELPGICYHICVDWYRFAQEVASDTGIFVDAIIGESKVVCGIDAKDPLVGETVYTIRGARNTQLCTDDNAWRNAVIEVVRRMKESHKNINTSITFSDVQEITID